MEKLVDALCSVDRPESIFVWKRPAQVQDLLRRLATGALPLNHEAFDTEDGRVAC
ncbi:hypothetical protein [Amycolatopsis sp. cmx-11-12]|uniref:hypothetical protein n=1 Tax=Amycolatopsis sp. cmx-11-12 TaxID=2785795 RepID=UPI003918299D